MILVMRETVLSFLDDYAARGNETALAHHHGLRVFRWSYARVRATAFQFAREIAARGIAKGDRVLFWADNGPEWVAAFFGCLLRGVIVVPLDGRSAAEFVNRVQQQVRAKLLLSGFDERRDSISGLPSITLAEVPSIVACRSSEPFIVEDIKASDLVEIIFTSGTTAEPKGVCISHKNLLANLEPLEREIQKYIRWERFVHPVRFLNLVPLSHVFGQFMGIFVPQLLGGEVFFQQSLNPSQIIATTKRERVSVIVAVPRQLETLRDKIERDYKARGRLESFRKKIASAEGAHPLKRWWIFRDIHRRFGWKFWAFVSGGATLDEATENFWQRLGFAVIQGYGMTETASLISVNHPFKMSRRSIGKTLPGQEVKLDESGEILVRGGNVSPGYWSSGVEPLIGDEGWLHTGDIGQLDEAGNLYFKGRKKDVIVTAAGLNVYPEDLEAELNRQPEVRDSAVIGVEGPRGPEPVAVLILKDERADPAEIIRRANFSLSEYQQIRRWLVWPDQDFPRTATTQKTLKRVIACVVESQMKGEEEQARGEKKIASSSSIGDLIASISGYAPARLDEPANMATDLKLDSLGRVELLSALEDRYQIEIDEAAFTAATTVADIEKIVREGPQNAAASEYPYPEWARRFPATWIRFAGFYLVILPAARLMCWPRVIGKSRLDDLRGPALFVSNHVTMTDHGLIMLALPAKLRRKLAIAMEGERLRDWRHPPKGTGWFARLRLLAQYALVVTLFNVFPLPQKSGFRRSFAFAGEAVDSGYSVLVFPEGRRTDDGRMRPFMSGTGMLAQDLNLPVVPVRIDGLFEMKKQRRYFARPGEVSLIFGEPVSFARGAAPSRIAKELELRVENL